MVTRGPCDAHRRKPARLLGGATERPLPRRTNWRGTVLVRTRLSEQVFPSYVRGIHARGIGRDARARDDRLTLRRGVRPLAPLLVPHEANVEGVDLQLGAHQTAAEIN